MIKSTLFIIFNFLLVVGWYLLFIKFFLRVEWNDAVGLIVIGFLGFLIGVIHYFRKRKDPKVSKKDVISVLIAMITSLLVIIILFWLISH